jgi:uncharacterized membrane protein
MSWNPNQGQDPNQPSQYGGYSGYNPPPPQPTDPYSGQQGGYQQGGQQGGFQSGQQQYGQGGYQQPYGGPGASQYGPSTMQIDPKTAAGLSYLGLWITGVIFFLMEKQNRFVRFHAMQSILFFGGIFVLDIILRFATAFSPDILGLALGCLSFLIGIVGVIGWIVLMINGFQGKYFKLPVIGDYAERYANQGIPGMPGM